MYSLTFGLCGAISQSQVEIDSNNQTTQHHEGGQTRNDSVANQKHSIYSANIIVPTSLAPIPKDKTTPLTKDVAALFVVRP